MGTIAPPSTLVTSIARPALNVARAQSRSFAASGASSLPSATSRAYSTNSGNGMFNAQTGMATKLVSLALSPLAIGATAAINNPGTAAALVGTAVVASHL